MRPKCKKMVDYRNLLKSDYKKLKNKFWNEEVEPDQLLVGSVKKSYWTGLRQVAESSGVRNV